MNRLKLDPVPRGRRGLACAALAAGILVWTSCSQVTSTASTRAEPPQAGHPLGTLTASSCATDFDSIRVIVRRDYAGYPTKGLGQESALAALADSVGRDMSAASDPAGCTAGLRRWIAFFRDHHLSVVDLRPSGAAAAANTAASDLGLPSISRLDDSTLLLRLPDFGQRRKQSIDSVIRANHERLAATPYLIVDVRGNGGGWTAAYAELLPFIATGPIRSDGQDGWASPGNINALRELVASTRGPEAIRAHARTVLARMEANPGTFVLFAADTVIVPPTVYPLPRAVAIIVDRRCASTCEQFVLDARQSRKVVVLGTGNTGGLLDFGNARGVLLPSGGRRLHVPFTRSHRLPNTPLDHTGIAPAVRIPPDTKDAVDYARQFLVAGGSGP